MNTQATSPVKMLIVFIVISAFSGFILSAMWEVSKQKIDRNDKYQMEKALFLTPDTKTYQTITKGEETFFQCYSETGQVVGKFFTITGSGFSGPIRLAVSVTPDWSSILGIQVLSQTDTPGLGALIRTPKFQNQFTNLPISEGHPIAAVKGMSDPKLSQIKAITGATISSRAVTEMINQKIAAMRKAGL